MGKDLKIKDYKKIYRESYDFIAELRSLRKCLLQELEHGEPTTDSEKIYIETCKQLTLTELHLLDNILESMDEIEYEEGRSNEQVQM